MRLIAVNECAKHFCRFFFQTKIKSVACAQKDARFYFFKLLVTKLLLRTDAILYLKTHFHIQALK